MITVRIKPITFDNNVRTDTYEFRNDPLELYNFRHSKYPRDEQGMQQLLLVEITVDEIGGKTFITCGDYLGKNVVKHVKNIVAERYMHCVLR